VLLKKESAADIPAASAEPVLQALLVPVTLLDDLEVLELAAGPQSVIAT
jgi:hypothetical protein